MARSNAAVASDIFNGIQAAKQGSMAQLRNVRSITDNADGTATVEYFDNGTVVTKTLTLS